MKLSNREQFGVFLATLILLSGAAGCSQSYNLKLAPVSSYSSAREKINLKVALHLTPEFTQYVASHEYNTGVTNKLPIGAALADNAERVTRSVFSTVTVNRETQVVDRQSQAVLTPRVVSFEGTMVRPFGFGAKNYEVINVEWSLTDLQGKAIWVGTLQGKGEAEVPTTVFGVQGMHANQMQIVMEELFRSTYDALTTAPEIRRFAAQRNPG